MARTASRSVTTRHEEGRWRDTTLSFKKRSALVDGMREIEENWEEPESITEYDFDRPSHEEKMKWHNQEKTPEETREIANKKDVGSLTISAIHTSYIEFHIDEPNGASKKCTCNDCWNEFYIAPFSSAVECPYCHRTDIHSVNHLPSDE